MSRQRTLTEKDRLDWDAYASRGSLAVPKPVDRGPEVAAPAIAPAPRRAAKKADPLAVGDQPGGLDKASWHRFRSGRLGPERTLDLHGRTAQRAHTALQSFLHTAHAEGVRCVEVVTGRGAGEAGGVLRRELPMWLNLPDLRPLVLAASYPHPANQGAVRLLLRRRR
jgi:DNA-nicking Smr family endonuclease